MDFKKLAIRSISGLIYITIIVVCTIIGTEAVMALAAVLGVLACVEFQRIYHELNRATIPLVILDCIGIVCLVMGWLVVPVLLWVAVMIMRLILQLYSSSDSPVRDMSSSMMTQIYIGMPLSLLVGIAYFSSPLTLLAIFILIWINDTGAFLIGSLCGRHRLFERISPKKSWEGFFGGLVFSVSAAALMGSFCQEFFNFYGIGAWIGLGVITVIFATWGDLVESLIKRNLRIKDSGNLIPGHGGILDRIDSLLLVIPAAFLYIILLSTSRLDYLF